MRITPDQLADIVILYMNGEISYSIANKIIKIIWESNCGYRWVNGTANTLSD